MTAEDARAGSQPEAEPVVRNELHGEVTGLLVQAHTITGGVHHHAYPPSRPAPRRLPTNPRGFTGQPAEPAQLTAATPATSQVDGPIVWAIEILDSELAAVQHPPAADAPEWSIDYRRHGGFLATSQPGDDARPWAFWGTAPTARAAAHVLGWYFLDQPPAIVFDPPLPTTPWPLATIGEEADLAPEGPSVADLLERRGRIYDEHFAACRTARNVLSGCADIPGYLAQRAIELNATDPQLRAPDALDATGSSHNSDHGGFAHTVQWVPTSLVVATDPTRWGDFGGHRDDSPDQIIIGLLSDDLHEFTTRLFTDTITLLRAPAWAGPLYRVGSNGNHRTHTARLLHLPWLAAAVEVESIATTWDMHDLVAADPEHDQDRHRLLQTRMQERAVLVTGLIRRGIIDGHLTHDGSLPILHCRRLPAAWLLRPPRYTTQINTVYESRYPGALEQLGHPDRHRHRSRGVDPLAHRYPVVPRTVLVTASPVARHDRNDLAYHDVNHTRGRDG